MAEDVPEPQRLNARSHSSPRRWLALLLAAGGLMMAMAWLARGPVPESTPVEPDGSWRERVPMAVIGDSDSHSYHDRILIPPGSRGGEYRPVTLQWTEVLDRLRGDEVDLGAWGEWGTRQRYALLRRALGREWRVPRKEDFEHDFALSGALCRDLTSGPERQLPPLISLLSRDAARWTDGVVVIRVGVNSVQRNQHIEHYVVNGLDAEARQRMDGCLDHIDQAVRSIRAAHPDVAIAVVGLFEEPDAAPLIERRFGADEIRNLREALSYFDERLRETARGDDRVVFVEGQQWWQRHWGTHGPEGEAEPGSVSLGGPEAVTNTQGDHPRNAVLADGHGGTVVNGFWLRHLVATLNEALGLGLSPISDQELGDLVDPDGSLGLSGGPLPSGEPLIDAPTEAIRLTREQLPWRLAGVRARDGDGAGADITETLVAWLEGGDTGPLWLFGAGRSLELRSPRHAPGTYTLHIRARDRSGRHTTASVPLVIEG